MLPSIKGFYVLQSFASQRKIPIYIYIVYIVNEDSEKIILTP